MTKIIDTNKFQEYIDQHLWNFDAKPLAYAWNSGENALLFGEGGYGKSVAAEMFHDFLIMEGAVAPNSKLFVQFMGPGMTEERFLGGIDIKEFNDEGRIIYLLQYAFANHEVVVFEEIWDAYPNVLLVLKDILTSKHVRNGSQYVPIRTKMIIANTNRSREEVISDNSTEALFQRFAIEHHVNWSTHLVSDYQNAISKATKMAPCKEISTVASLCHMVSSDKDISYMVSPRTAVKAFRIFQKNGIDALSYMYGFKSKVSQLMVEIAKMEAEVKANEERLKDIVTFCKKVKAIIANNDTPFAQKRYLVGDMAVVFDTIKNVSIPDDSVQMEKFSKLRAAVGNLSEQIWKSLYMEAESLDQKIFSIMNDCVEDNDRSRIEFLEFNKYSQNLYLLHRKALPAGISFNRPTFGTQNAKSWSRTRK